MKLTEHFNREEFEHSGAMPSNVVPAYVNLCAEILEPIREQFETPLTITSGYRSPDHNKEIGGAKGSQHMATPDFCAADFKCAVDMQVVFDWIRLSSGLPFDQVILEHEHGDGPPACIHISWAKDYRRVALEGLTHGRSSYVKRDVELPIIAKAHVDGDEHFGG